MDISQVKMTLPSMRVYRKDENTKEAILIPYIRDTIASTEHNS